jgi:hypothetical protein
LAGLLAAGPFHGVFPGDISPGIGRIRFETALSTRAASVQGEADEGTRGSAQGSVGPLLN